MDEERKQKTAALNSKKKLEGDLKDLESTMDMNNKMKEDAIKQLKKHQAALKELTRDADEAHLAKAEAIQQYKEFEKKFKGVEADLIQMQEDLSAAERYNIFLSFPISFSQHFILVIVSFPK